ERQQQEDADDHGKRVMIDQARLQQAHHRGQTTDQPCGAVDEETVDELHVADLPQPAADAAHTAGKDALVEAVEAVLVLENAIKAAEARLERSRDVRAPEVEEP